MTLMSDYDVAEGFVYDYKKHIWYKFTKAGVRNDNNSVSDTIKTDLNTFLLKRQPL